MFVTVYHPELATTATVAEASLAAWEESGWKLADTPAADVAAEDPDAAAIDPDGTPAAGAETGDPVTTQTPSGRGRRTTQEKQS